MKCNRLRNRDKYLEEAMLFRDTDLIKVITGVRRCGKSSLLDLIRITIESEGVAGRGFVSVNLESKGTGKHPEIAKAFLDWGEAHSKLESGEMSQEEYEIWKDSYSPYIRAI